MGVRLTAPTAKQADTGEVQSRLAWFVSWTPLSMLVVYLMVRWNLGVDWWLVVKVLGWSWFWLLVPVQLATTRAKRVPAELIAFMAVVVVAATGYVGNEHLKLFEWVIPGCGVFSWLLSTYYWRSRIVRSEWITLPWLVWLSSWFALRVWGSEYLSPLFRENVATMAAHPDTLFHLAIANMLKTYGVVTTGLDGLVALPYHAGSHWLLAGWSWWLAAPVIETYNVLYPVVWLPLLLLVSWWLSVRIAATWSTNLSSVTNWLSWLVLISWIGWVQPWPLSWQNHWQLETVLMFSESYTIGLAVTGLIAGWWLSSSRKDTHRWPWLVLNLGVWLFVGWIKISFLYFGLVLSWWWLFRSWRTTSKKQWFMAGVLSALAVVVYRLTSLPDHAVTWQPGAFWVSKLAANWRLSWWPVALADWLIVLGWWWQQPQRWRLLKTWPAQASTLIIGAGLLPAFLLLMPGGNEVYFLEVQRWWAVALLGAAWFRLKSNGVFFRNNKTKSLGRLVIGVLLVAGLTVNYLWATKILVVQVSTRQARYHQLYDDPRAEFQEIMRWLQQVSELSLSQKQQLALSISPTSKYWRLSSRCDVVSLIAPAWTGVQLAEGLPKSGCSRSLFGHRLYPNYSSVTVTDRLLSP